MLAAFVIVFVVTQSAYCRSLPLQPQSSHAIVELSNRNPVELIRHVRQSGKRTHMDVHDSVLPYSCRWRGNNESSSDYNPYDMYPDTGKNPNTYPQQQQDSNNYGLPFSVGNFPTIFGKR